MSRGEGKKERALLGMILHQGKPMTFGDMRRFAWHRSAWFWSSLRSSSNCRSAAMSDMHFLILGMRSGKTACGLRVHCFYPLREETQINGAGENVIGCAPCTRIAFRVTCKECRRVLDAKADIRKTSELNPDGGEESSPRMAKNMAMTPADKAELARLDVGWMLSKWRMMRRLSAERTSWMGCFVPKNETAHAVERAGPRRGL